MGGCGYGGFVAAVLDRVSLRSRGAAGDVCLVRDFRAAAAFFAGFLRLGSFGVGLAMRVRDLRGARRGPCGRHFEAATKWSYHFQKHALTPACFPYSARVAKLAPEAMRDFLNAELDKVGLPHATFSPEALALIVRASEGVLRRTRNLCLATLIECVRDRTKTVDLKQVNRVLMQPHWREPRDA